MGSPMNSKAPLQRGFTENRNEGGVTPSLPNTGPGVKGSLSVGRAINFEHINTVALAHLEDLLTRWFPAGRIIGSEYEVGSLEGEPGKSFKVNLGSKRGVWTDFAGNEKGSDPVSLYAAINGTGQAEAAIRLSGELGINPYMAGKIPAKVKPLRPASDEWQIVLPVPGDAPGADFHHPRLGQPVASWEYKDAHAQLLGYVCRFEPDGEKKQVLPLTFWRGPGGILRWMWKAFPEPRPLYNLEGLAKAAASIPTLFPEGEKATEAAKRLVHGVVCMTYPMGCKAVDKADFSPVKGRRVAIWPDADKPGFEAALAVAAKVKEAGAVEVSIIMPPEGVAEGWDLADAEAEGWTPAQVNAHIKANRLDVAAFEKVARERYGVEDEPAKPVVVGDNSDNSENSLVFSEKLDAPSLDEWEPTPSKSWPILSMDALPGIVGEFVHLATRGSEADPAAVLATFLAQFACNAGGTRFEERPYLMVGDSRHEPRMFVVVAGQSAIARKGTSMAPVERLFAPTELVPFPRALTVPGPLSSGEGIVHAVRDEIREWVVDKKSGAGVWQVKDPGISDKRLFVRDEELAAALRCTKREGNTLSTILRGLWDSGTVAPLTKTAPTKATNAHVCIVAHITIEELHRVLDEVEVFNGFVNRFLWVLARRTRIVPLPKAMPQAELSRLQQAVMDRVRAAYSVGCLELTPDAESLWGKIYPTLTADLGGMLGAATSRAAPQTLRLAMIYALLDGKRSIEPGHLKAGLAFCDYAKASAAYIFGDKNADSTAGKIMAALKQAAAPMSATELHRALGNSFTREQLQIALNNLTASGLVVHEKQATKTKPKNLFKLTEKSEFSEFSPPLTSGQGNNSDNSDNSEVSFKKWAGPNEVEL